MKLARRLLLEGGIDCSACEERLCDIFQSSSEDTRRLSKVAGVGPRLQLELYRPEGGPLCLAFFGFDLAGRFSNNCPACGRGWDFAFNPSQEETARLEIDCLPSDKAFQPPADRPTFSEADRERERQRRESTLAVDTGSPLGTGTPFTDAPLTLDEELRLFFQSSDVRSPYDSDSDLSKLSPLPLNEAVKEAGVRGDDRVLVQLSKNLAHDRRMQFRARNSGVEWRDVPLLERTEALPLVQVAQAVRQEEGFAVLEVRAEQVKWEEYGPEMSVYISFAVPRLFCVFTASANGQTSIRTPG